MADLIAAFGLLVTAAGVALISVPAALMVLGAECVLVGVGARR
jgi:hypothetical protein